MSSASTRLGRARVGAKWAPVPLEGPAETGLDTLSERVYQSLKRDIVTGVLRPGESLTEKDLAARYCSSRTPVREASHRLAEQNLLRIIPNRGYFVSHLTVKDLNDIFEYRAALECASAELAALRGIPGSLLPELNRLAARRSRPGHRASYEAFIQADTAFHVALARISQNPLLVKAVADMRCQIERILYTAIDTLDANYYYGDLPVAGHQAILRAVREGDVALARKLMHQHLVGAKPEIIQIISSRSRLF